MRRIHNRDTRRAVPRTIAFAGRPGEPLITVVRLGREHALGPAAEPHSHAFLALVYYARGGGVRRAGDQSWAIEAGDVFVIPPGHVQDVRGGGDSEGWAVLFPPEVLTSRHGDAWLAWRAHPLLFPFVDATRGPGAATQRLQVPPAQQAAWTARVAELERELCERPPGYHEAAYALVRLLVVGVARLTGDDVLGARRDADPLLTAVFGVIEQRYREPITLTEVAQTLGLTAGHVTTAVRRKTGRTVVAWITERRMAEARRLLVETDLAVEELGRRCGYNDATHFVRMFRRAHGATPGAWRRAYRA